MKTPPLVFLGVLLSATALRAADEPKASPEGGKPGKAAEKTTAGEKEVRATIEALIQAFQKGEAKTIAGLFTEDGEAIDEMGAAIQGRAAIEEHYASRLASDTTDKVETMVDSVKFLTPGVARVTGRMKVIPADGMPPSGGQFTAIEVKVDDRWLVASLRELSDAQVSPHEHLKELEWMVGDWIEESEDAVISSSVSWAENKNFLIRSFDVRIKGKEALTGSHRIGWDPLTNQIKSWVFDSTGGHGEGLWMRAGNQWVIKAMGVRPDGRTTTATQVLTFIDKDHLGWKSLDRTLGDEITDDIDELFMVRKPPQPK